MTRAEPCMTRAALADAILARLAEQEAELAKQWRTPGRVETWVVDGLLPIAIAEAINAAFPPATEMVAKKSIREHKLIAVQMDRYHRTCEEIVFAFQDQRIVALLSRVCGIPALEADPHLYAGGLSSMAKGHYLLPHLDNSHDRDRQRYRVLNLLYYVTPGWGLEHGGNLELWDSGPKGQPRPIESRFNRLVCMATHRHSWHSVQQVRAAGPRNCVSNYYFSPQPVEGADYFHVTSFRGRPEQPVRDLVLQADIALRQGLRKVFKKGVRENPHVYRRPEPPI